MTLLESARRIVEAEDEHNAAEKAHERSTDRASTIIRCSIAWNNLKFLTQEHGPAVARALLEKCESGEALRPLGASGVRTARSLTSAPLPPDADPKAAAKRVLRDNLTWRMSDSDPDPDAVVVARALLAARGEAMEELENAPPYVFDAGCRALTTPEAREALMAAELSGRDFKFQRTKMRLRWKAMIRALKENDNG